MGRLVLAAKITHVPSIWLSEQPGPQHGIRRNAIEGLVELGRRARARGVETFVVLDVHWQVTIGFHVNAKERHRGAYTSHELPHFIADLPYDYAGDPRLADGIAAAAEAAGLRCHAHRTPGLGLEYATLIPMHHMHRDAAVRVLPVAVNVNASIDESARFGAALRGAIERGDHAVALLASGSLSHRFWPNDRAEAGLDEVSSAFNREVDLRVLEMWRGGRIADFLAMLPDYARHCSGEAAMGDTAMLFGALGWDRYRGRGELLGEYFGSSGTGQCNVEFPLDATT
ncbi:MAG TPA: 3,4-dihydroxyphenylacetate 2,3-dioxygenase [Candidatus Binatia bacterium]|jgi:3,4-dihydroxyphenylacetate 2,3-dioxygenase